jgi:MOSC domain-containing protein YiiM
MDKPGNYGKIESLHFHSQIQNKPMISTSKMSLVEGKGILGNPRYYDKTTAAGQKNRRQVSLIEREQVAEHENQIEMKLEAGVVRSNIETSGIDLIDMIDKYLMIGDKAVLYIFMARKPCYKMDDICDGLQNLMKGNRQGVIGEVIISGDIKVGDIIKPVDEKTVNELKNKPVEKPKITPIEKPKVVQVEKPKIEPKVESGKMTWAKKLFG